MKIIKTNRDKGLLWTNGCNRPFPTSFEITRKRVASRNFGLFLNCQFSWKTDRALETVRFALLSNSVILKTAVRTQRPRQKTHFQRLCPFIRGLVIWPVLIAILRCGRKARNSGYEGLKLGNLDGCFSPLKATCLAKIHEKKRDLSAHCTIFEAPK